MGSREGAPQVPPSEPLLDELPPAALQALLEISRAALEGMDQDAVLGHVARRARAQVGAELAMAVACDAGSTVYRVRAADGRQEEKVLGAALGAWQPQAAGASGGAAPITDTWLAALVGAGPAVSVPLPDGTQRSPWLVLVREPGGAEFSQTELRPLELFAAQASVAINHVALRDRQQRLAVVAERDRIGRELHDGTIQALFSVGISLQGSEMLTDDSLLLARIENGVAQIDGVISDLRNYVFGLRPGGLTRRPLDEALYELADRFQLDHGVSTTVDVDGGLAAELIDVAPDLLQLTREAVANVAKHAGARNCAITLRRSGDQALLEVEDDGAGFVPEKARGRGGWGLRNIEERAAALGAKIDIQTAMSAGTTIRLVIPR